MFGVLWVFLRSVAGQILYLALHLETGRFPRPLTRGEELAAFDAMRAGDRDARDTLIRHNLRLVVHVTKKYYAAQSSQDDFISIGTIGLIKAVDTYDPSRPTRFASYASRCIENELRMQLRRTRREGTVASLQEPLEGDSGMLTLADVLPDEDGGRLRTAGRHPAAARSGGPTARPGAGNHCPPLRSGRAAAADPERACRPAGHQPELCIPPGKARHEHAARAVGNAMMRPVRAAPGAAQQRATG